jgi:predicted CXXCH cytochrome family protein
MRPGLRLHGPFRGADCLTCHLPHSGGRAALAADGAAVCLACHGDLKEALEKPGATVHPPVAEGCLSCHQGHGSAVEGLLRKIVPALCADCHDLASGGLAARHGGFDVGTSACGGCHVMHAGQARKLLRAGLHQPFEVGTCDACHAPDAPRLLAAHRGTKVTDRCVECHPPHAQRTRSPRAPG